ncbi:MAG TPA: YkgJ family cysteine cluster protein [Candidatus Hydrogenedentes bacterium]|nr:YkgJ family cysteine cluster protein [Candidatus Hydrogenedentota bacterium]HPG65604.1 YkgJ family cysteine cluster protein [Candidatus Hydrogenedentota bacterium]
MGKKTVRFSCHHCGHCCTDVVCLPTPWDVIRIARATGLHPSIFLEFLTPDEITGVDKSDPTWLEFGDRRYLMAIRRDIRTGCYFRDRRTKRCAVYEHRPILCRLYPLKLHESRSGEFRAFSVHGNGVGCPRHRDGTMECAPVYALWLEDCLHQEDYDTLVAVFNRKRYADKRPEDFIGMFVQEAPCPSSATEA